MAQLQNETGKGYIKAAAATHGDSRCKHGESTAWVNAFNQVMRAWYGNAP